MTNVVAHEGGALIFGIGGVCLPDACGGLPPNGGTIEWASSDGRSWERLSDTGLADGAVLDVISTEDGLVAVGYVANDGSKPVSDAFTGQTDAAVWRSTDGRHWTVVADLPVADRLARVSALGSSIVALASSQGSTVPWTSSDGGLSWVDGSELALDCCSSSATGDGLAIVVSTTDTDEGMDGIVSVANPATGSWMQHSPPMMRDYRPAMVQALGGSFVIFGWTTYRDDVGLPTDDRPISYSSLDGIEWVTTKPPPAWDGQGPVSVAARGDDLVAILGPLDSLNGPAGDLVFTVWIGTAAD
jgi:hypothetical protein